MGAEAGIVPSRNQVNEVIEGRATRVTPPGLPPPSIADQLREAEAELKAHRRRLFERHSRRGRTEYMREVDWMIRQSMAALERELRANPSGTVRWDCL